MRRIENRSSRGFSLVELLVVVAIALMITALAAPSIMRAMHNSRLRGSATSLSTLLAQARSLAVQRNCTATLMAQVESAENRARYWAELDAGMCGGNDALDAGDPQVTTANQVRPVSTVAAPPASALGFTPQGAAVPIRFNSRGLPCVRGATACQNVNGGAPVGFFVALQDQRSGASASIAGVSVGPSGRVHVWRYTDGTWKQ